jgi:hypothetical protein
MDADGGVMTTSTMTKALAAALMYLWVAACGSQADVFDEDDDGSSGLGGAGSATCQAYNWRAESPKAVTCPGAESCSCGGSDVCCLIYDEAQDRVTSGSCMAEAQCADFAFACDGPEDCSDGNVCCARGRGAHCLPDLECHGVETFTLCRGDADCPDLETCTPDVTDSYYEDLIGFCD